MNPENKDDCISDYEAKIETLRRELGLSKSYKRILKVTNQALTRDLLTAFKALVKIVDLDDSCSEREEMVKAARKALHKLKGDD